MVPPLSVLLLHERDAGDPSGTPGTAAADAAYTDPLLTTNLVCRVLFGILANLVCWVPLRLLYSNGEFAAVVLIVTVMTLNLLTIVNALVWRDDNVGAWWHGDGWCDFQNYFYNPLLLVYAGCILAIMRNLAQQLGTLRASAMTTGERTRRNLVQALVIFPVPLVQLGWVYPLMTRRYAIGTLVGCIWVPAAAWPFIVFFVLPAPLMAVATGYYAVLVWIRFRAIQRTTKAALGGNSLAAARAHRARRRLFLMTLAILIPYLPLICVYAVTNILGTLPLHAFDFGAIHDRGTWGVVDLVPSGQLEFAFVNANYIPILTAVPIFWFFGMTAQAIRLYRRYLVAIGLGRVFPSLGRDYDPDASLVTATTQTETSRHHASMPQEGNKGRSRPSTATATATANRSLEAKEFPATDCPGAKERGPANRFARTFFSRKTFGLPRAADFEGVSGQEIAAATAASSGHRRRGLGFRTAGNPFYPPSLQELRGKAATAAAKTTTSDDDKPPPLPPPSSAAAAAAAAASDWEWGGVGGRGGAPASGRSHFETRAWSDNDGRDRWDARDHETTTANSSTAATGAGAASSGGDSLSIRSDRGVVMTTRIDTTMEKADN